MVELVVQGWLVVEGREEEEEGLVTALVPGLGGNGWEYLLDVWLGNLIWDPSRRRITPWQTCRLV